MPDKLPELDKILHSGNLAYGKWTREFENSLRDFTGEENIMAVNSFSSAICVALSALGLKPGDEVISSPVSCLASNLPLHMFGLTVRWADVDPHTGTLDPESVRAKISPRTKLIFHNHICGYLGYIDEINAIGKEAGIPVIDDCIEAFGSEYRECMAGNLGADVTVFNFQTIRLPNTIEGGAIAFKDPVLYRKALLMRDMGIDRSLFRDELGEISPACDVTEGGYAAMMNDVNGYIGYLQMQDIRTLLERQRRNAVKWSEYFDASGHGVVRMNDRTEVNPNYWVYGILAEDKMKTLSEMRERGYYASGVHLNNDSYSVFGSQGRLPGVEEFSNKFLAVPSGWWVEEILK